MKSIKSILLVAMFAILSYTSVNATNEPVTESSLVQQIKQSIQYPSVDDNEGVEGTVKVSFFVDAQNQINVINVASANTMLANYVKSSLNGKKVTVNADQIGVKYSTDVVFKYVR